MASYEANMRQGKQLQLEADGENHVVLYSKDIQDLIVHQEEIPSQLHWRSSNLELEDPQIPHMKEEEEDPQHPLIKEEEKVFDGSKLPLTAVSVKSEDDHEEPPEFSQLHHHSPCGGDHFGEPPPDKLLAPLSDSDDMEEPLRSDTDCEGDHNPLTFFEKRTTLGNKETSQMRKHVTCSVCAVFRPQLPPPHELTSVPPQDPRFNISE
ncbi:uncharacterized protein LOC133475757 isoform X3 [Phyllopteryx taeniolatus]|uniref:uncharacterized protein LOC133475757 isoform X3 n=1 Tax=Phyllopteryx taeniolatus TaxID=161469 RepID=UPI002AD3CFAA|nr:uncharacterized protein LOC133475757 isoform X3 [Phyllopteryx taeniolatus]